MRTPIQLTALALGLGVLAGCVTFPAPDRTPTDGRVFEEHDAFKGVTYVHLRGLSIPIRDGWSRLDFNAWVLKEQPGAISMMITTTGSSWQYLQCHMLDFLADGAPVPISETRHDGSVGAAYSVYVIEHVFFTIEPPSFEQLVGAQEVRGRLCTTEFTFTATQLRQLRAFGARIGLSPPPSPSAGAVLSPWNRAMSPCVPLLSPCTHRIAPRNEATEWSVFHNLTPT